jgi:hypothetical protein
MPEVEVRLPGRKLADAMSELRQWLDHNQCTPADFGILSEGGDLVVRITFSDDEMADRFQRQFGC